MTIMMFYITKVQRLLPTPPPFLLRVRFTHDLTTLPSNRVWFYPSARAMNGRETYERRALGAVTAGGTQPGDVH